jgi:hypothetical protein
MLRPREDGLRDASELDELGALEDQFVEALAEKVDAIYVGRTVHAGDTTLYLYVPEEHREALDALPDLTGAPLSDHEPSWGVVDDPGWQQYLQFLSPDEYAHQSIWNRRLITQFSEMGDAHEVAREIDHMAFFPTKEAAEEAAKALAAAGFRVDPVTSHADEDGDEGEDDEDEVEDGEDGDEDGDDEGEDEDGGDHGEDEDDGDEDDDDDEDGDDEERWSLQFHRDDALADGRPDEFVSEILDVILPLGGSYDGWGAEHRKAADSPDVS